MATNVRKDTNPTDRRPVIMVSSTVYGIEDLLEQIFGILTGAGFTVWMSHKGTVPVDSGKSNFANCLAAVEKCDYFLGILTTSYGSGKEGDDPSITHEEIRAALTRDIPRWFLAHHDLVFARSLIRDLGHRMPGDTKKLNDLMMARHEKGKTPMIRDFRALEVYDEVIQARQKLSARRGNWAQKFATDRDAQIFVVAQFLRYAEALEIVEQQPLSAMKAHTKPEGVNHER